MKINKNIVISFIIILFCTSLISASKKYHKSNKAHHKNKINSRIWDNNYSPNVIKDLILHSIDNKLDEEKLLNTCLDLFVDSVKLDGIRKDFWGVLEKFATSPSEILGYSKIKKFIASLEVESTLTEKKTKCNDYVVGCLKTEKVLNSAQQNESARQLLKTSLGLPTAGALNKNNNFITSFASYNRDSSLRSPKLFKRLNGRDI